MRDLMFPPGRLVGGSVYRAQPKTNNDGTARIDTVTGKPMIGFSFGVAYPKNGSTHFGQTPWGAEIWQEGHAAWPNGQAGAPTFAWKVTDGDSQIPNKKGRKPCDNEGWPGHWVVWFSGTFPPKTCNADGSREYTVADGEIIKPGHFVQVAGSVDSNKSTQSPGLYLNYKAVAHSAFGPEIALSNSIDTKTAGFGGQPLPPGASAVPLGQMPGAAPAGAPALPAAVPGVPAVPMAAPVMPSAAPAVQMPAVQPSTAFLAPVAAVPVAIPAVSVPSTEPQLTPTAAANGWTYAMLKGAGHSDAAMRANGWIV
jgi:hypothetical protein